MISSRTKDPGLVARTEEEEIAWLRCVTSITEHYCREIDQSLDFLKADLRDPPLRQRSMWVVFDHSWDVLTERDREVVCELEFKRLWELSAWPNLIRR